MTDRKAQLFLGALFLFMLCAGGLGAQQQYEGQLIVDVGIRGARRVDESEIRAHIKTRPGDEFSQRAVSEDLASINSTGFFSNVEVLVEETPEGLHLTFAVTEKNVIFDLRFRGNREFDDAELSKTVGLNEGGFFDSYLFNAGEEKVMERYRGAGFAQVRVTSSAELRDEGYYVRYEIVEGPALRISRIRFEGNRAFSSGKLGTLVQTKAVRLFLGGGLFDEDGIQRDALRIKVFYIDNGYRDVTVEPTFSYNRERTRVTVIYTIVEGPRYTIGEIELRGNELFTGKEIRSVMRVEPGDDFIEEKIIREQQNIVDMYGERGHLDATVTARATYREVEPIADITYEIQEGSAFRVGKITIQGNYKTKDKVIRRNIRFAPGDVYNTTQETASVAALYHSGYFEGPPTVTRTQGDQPDTKDVVIEVSEGRTGDIMFGLGVTSNSGAFGSISLVQRNFDIADFPTSLGEFFTGNAFVGAGQYLSLSVQPGTEFSNYRLDFREPYLFDRPYSLTFSVFHHDRAFSNYDETRTGGIIGLGRRFKRNFSVEGAFRIEAIDISDIDPSAPADLLAVDGTNEIQSFIFTLNWDTRDNVWLPSRGYQIVASVEPAGQLLGGDFEFTKYLLRGSCYLTLYTDDLDRKHIVSLSAQGGIVEPVGDSDQVPIFERFFAGGAATIRGFDFRGVGPHVAGDAIGGESMVLASLEYSFPIYQNSIRGVVFSDAGAVYPDAGDFDFSEIRAAAGVGLRIYIPYFGRVPFAFDWGFAFASEPGDEEEVFSFSIGVRR
jgi:outer membrane protein assembly complex protein YaeT